MIISVFIHPPHYSFLQVYHVYVILKLKFITAFDPSEKYDKNNTLNGQLKGRF